MVEFREVERGRVECREVERGRVDRYRGVGWSVESVRVECREW